MKNPALFVLTLSFFALFYSTNAVLECYDCVWVKPQNKNPFAVKPFGDSCVTPGSKTNKVLCSQRSMGCKVVIALNDGQLYAIQRKCADKYDEAKLQMMVQSDNQGLACESENSKTSCLCLPQDQSSDSCNNVAVISNILPTKTDTSTILGDSPQQSKATKSTTSFDENNEINSELSKTTKKEAESNPNKRETKDGVASVQKVDVSSKGVSTRNYFFCKFWYLLLSFAISVYLII